MAASEPPGGRPGAWARAQWNRFLGDSWV